MAVSYTTKHVLIIDLANTLLSIYAREMKAYVHTKTYTRMLIAYSRVIPQNWKPKCPSTCEWLNQLWYIHIMKH